MMKERKSDSSTESKPSMKLLDLISLPNEPWLEKWARLFRYQQADSILEEKLKTSSSLTLIDYGCGQDVLYYKYLQYVFTPESKKIHYIGLDPLLPKNEKRTNQVRLIRAKFEDVGIKEKADVITMFAVLEHVDNPEELVREASKLLKPDGYLIITTPTPLAKLPLEFFSRFLGIISAREIEEHKRYPDKAFLLEMEKAIKPNKIQHKYFELGLNNFCLIGKHVKRA